jgi:subtilisin family serine protease
MMTHRTLPGGVAALLRFAAATLVALTIVLGPSAHAQTAGPPNIPPQNLPNLGPTPTITNIPRITGNEPNATSLVPNTRLLLDQNKSGGPDTNFLTQDWGKSKRYSARTPGKRIKQPTDNAGGGGNNNNVATGPFGPSMLREVLIIIAGQPTDAVVQAMRLKHRLEQIESQNIPLIGSTVFRWRIPDGRSIETVRNELSRDGITSQPNLRYVANQAARVPTEGDPGQYGVAKLRLPEAHQLTRGKDVAVAVIDSGVDVTHPEIAGSVIGTFDALNSTEGPHPHGTGVAGTIIAHSRLIGSAPGAGLIAIRAFGANQSNGAESTSFVVLKALNYAVQQNAQVINMSFAGPRDPLVQQALAVASARGTVLIAAVGNAGPNSPPLYPAADSHVIAVTATDPGDHLFPAANRGAHVALAAPGVDILMPAPEDKYQVNSGTSFAAAYITGLAALLIDRNPGITPEGVRAALTGTARDLGAKGRDVEFGAGLADALAAVEVVSRPVTAGGAQPQAAPVPAATPATR